MNQELLFAMDLFCFVCFSPFCPPFLWCPVFLSCCHMPVRCCHVDNIGWFWKVVYTCSHESSAFTLANVINWFCLMQPVLIHPVASIWLRSLNSRACWINVFCFCFPQRAYLYKTEELVILVFLKYSVNSLGVWNDINKLFCSSHPCCIHVFSSLNPCTCFSVCVWVI